MINNMYELRQQVFDGLDVTAEIIVKQGQDINIGEKFTVRFRVSHRYFDPRTGWYSGDVSFRDCRLLLEETAYAKPLAGSKVEMPLGDLTYVGQALQKEVEFMAVGKIPNSVIFGRPADLPEQYVKVRVESAFHIVGFFRYWRATTFYTQIAST